MTHNPAVDEYLKGFRDRAELEIGLRKRLHIETGSLKLSAQMRGVPGIEAHQPDIEDFSVAQDIVTNAVIVDTVAGCGAYPARFHPLAVDSAVFFWRRYATALPADNGGSAGGSPCRTGKRSSRW